MCSEVDAIVDFANILDCKSHACWYGFAHELLIKVITWTDHCCSGFGSCKRSQHGQLWNLTRKRRRCIVDYPLAFFTTSDTSATLPTVSPHDASTWNEQNSNRSSLAAMVKYWTPHHVSSLPDLSIHSDISVGPMNDTTIVFDLAYDWSSLT